MLGDVAKTSVAFATRGETGRRGREILGLSNRNVGNGIGRTRNHYNTVGLSVGLMTRASAELRMRGEERIRCAGNADLA